MQKINDEFLSLNMLKSGNLRDSDYEEYEPVEEGEDFIEYKPEGMRGKRAYIALKIGRHYPAWSGPLN